MNSGRSYFNETVFNRGNDVMIVVVVVVVVIVAVVVGVKTNSLTTITTHNIIRHLSIIILDVALFNKLQYLLPACPSK
jgi:hypothetical protein